MVTLLLSRGGGQRHVSVPRIRSHDDASDGDSDPRAATARVGQSPASRDPRLTWSLLAPLNRETPTPSRQPPVHPSLAVHEGTPGLVRPPPPHPRQPAHPQRQLHDTSHPPPGHRRVTPAHCVPAGSQGRSLGCERDPGRMCVRVGSRQHPASRSRPTPAPLPLTRNEGVPGSSPDVGFKPGFACGHRADLDGNPAGHPLSPERRGGGRVGRRARPPLG
jgi:hypothetical protein